MASEYRYMVCRQHAGTGFPMGVQYATGNRKEANAAAKAMAGRAELDVYYSVNDAANSAARPRFFYPGKDGGPSLPLPEVVEVKLHGLTNQDPGLHDRQGAWVTMRYANGWAKWSLWPVENGRVMPGWPKQDRYTLAPGVLDHLNEAIRLGQVEEVSEPDGQMSLAAYMTHVYEMIEAELFRRQQSASAVDKVAMAGKQMQFYTPA